MALVRVRDTSEDARLAQLAVLRQMGPAERVRVAVKMSEEAREIAAAGVRARHPAWSEARVRRAVLERIYGAELVERAWGRLSER